MGYPPFVPYQLSARRVHQPAALPWGRSAWATGRVPGAVSRGRAGGRDGRAGARGPGGPPRQWL